MAKGSKNLYLSTNPTVQPPQNLHIPVLWPGEPPAMKTGKVEKVLMVSPLEAYPNTITIKRQPK